MCPTANHHQLQYNSVWQVLYIHYEILSFSSYLFLPPPAPSPPSSLSVSQNGLESALVSWTAPSGGATVTGYIIYYQLEEEGGQRLSESAEAAATTASITGLIAGVTYSITMVATSSTLPSTETAALTVTIGTFRTFTLRRTVNIILFYIIIISTFLLY